MGQPARLFVYGTLMPGHEAWTIIEPYAAATVATTVRGRLYDTGAGYPAAIFEGDSLIAGAAVILDEARAGEALDVLDRYEGPEYRRIVVDDDHGPLFAYEWIADRDRLIELPSGSWTDSA
jgi:gamma-glutamylcyclotransferase (GGCT)/AIG2-like uncharacterized protein YtfP